MGGNRFIILGGGDEYLVVPLTQRDKQMNRQDGRHFCNARNPSKSSKSSHIFSMRKRWCLIGYEKYATLSINVTPLPFLQYSPSTESCYQLALGVFQILKALFWHDLSKYTPSNSHAYIIEITATYNTCIALRAMLWAIKINQYRCYRRMGKMSRYLVCLACSPYLSDKAQSSIQYFF